MLNKNLIILIFKNRERENVSLQFQLKLFQLKEISKLRFYGQTAPQKREFQNQRREYLGKYLRLSLLSI